MDKYHFDNNDFNILKIKLQKEGSLKLNIASESMQPWIWKGSKIEIRPINSKDLKPFDIIVFFQDKKLICHFLYIKDDTFLITKGLKSFKFDEKINYGQLLGICTSHKPNWLQRFFLKRDFDKVWKLQNK